MAAGLGFKDFATGEVLTAADVDGYLMQGVWVFASATARDAAVTSPQEGNFAYLKDTNVTTYYTGSAWANLDTTGMTNPMTTTGDTIYSSSGSTPARLGIGSTGQVMTVAAGVPSWATPASASTQVATFTDEKASGTDGGTFTSGAWRTRDLNTTVFNNITSCSLSSNQISLPAGTYMVNAQAPGFDISQGQTRLYNITDSSVTIAGASTYCAAGSSDATAPSLVLGAFTIAGTKTFELQHRAGETQATNGFGVATGFGDNNVYSQITITKVG
jgi:hypothetical protein